MAKWNKAVCSETKLSTLKRVEAFAFLLLSIVIYFALNHSGQVLIWTVECVSVVKELMSKVF